MEDKALIVKKLCETLQLTRRYGDIADMVYMSADEWYTARKGNNVFADCNDDEHIDIVFAGGEHIEVYANRADSGYALLRRILKALKMWR